MEKKNKYKQYLDQLSDINDMLRSCYKPEYGSFVKYCKNPTNLTLGQMKVLQNFNINVKNKIFENNIELIGKICKEMCKYNIGAYDDYINESYVHYSNVIYTWNKDKSPFPNFLCMVLKRRLIDIIKRKKQEDFLNDEQLKNHLYFDGTSFEDKEFVDNILNKTNLTDFQKEILNGLMHPYVGWQGELAKKHNVTNQWVSECLTRTLKKLKNRFAND